MNLTEILRLVWPLIVIQLAFQIYALVDLFRKNKTRNLSVLVWAIIIILGEIVGPAAYFLVGRSEE